MTKPHDDEHDDASPREWNQMPLGVAIAIIGAILLVVNLTLPDAHVTVLLSNTLLIATGIALAWKPMIARIRHSRRR